MLSFGFKANNTGGGAPIPPVAKVPKVKGSEIYANNGKRIVVEWDTEMKGTASLKDAINIIVNGGAPIHPLAVTFNAKFMMMTGSFLQGDTVTWAYNDQHVTERLSTKVGDTEADNQTYGVDNKLVATAAFVSAEVPASSGGWHVDVTLSDDTGYASVSGEWELTVDGTKRNDIFVTGHNTTKFQLRFVAGTDQTKLIKGGQTVTVTHKVEDSGVKKFTDSAVTNNLAVTPPPPPPDDDDEPMLDLDGDGLPDEELFHIGQTTMTIDGDSLNIDIDGDGIADIVIPRRKK